MKHLFIINPAAGKKDSTEALVARIHELEGLDTEIRFTKGAGDAEVIAREAAAQGIPMRIYACGGDGTLNEVVNGAAGQDHVAITNVAKGTGNDFLKIFGDGWKEGFNDLKALSEGPQAAFDLIDCNGKLGIGVVCTGIDARVAADVHRYKSLPLVTGIGAYILSLVSNVFKGLATPMQVEMGDYRYDGGTALVVACSGRYYGGGFMPVGDAMPDDGVLDFLVIPKISLFTFARLVGQYAKGKYKNFPQYIHPGHGSKVTITSPVENAAAVDGEILRSKTYTIALSDKKVNFFWPAYLDYHTPSEG